MDKSYAMVIGMTIAYAASFAGLILAWIYYKKQHGKGEKK